MVSKDSALAGSGSNVSCIKHQKNLMNSLSSSNEHAQRSTNLYRDSYGTVHSLPPMSGSASLDKRPQPRSKKPGPAQADRSNDNAHEETTSESASDGRTRQPTSDGLPEAGSQPCPSEAEDSLLDGLAGFVDSSNMASSEDVRTLACVQVDVRTEVVLIDEDDDDMSLRERTVTDVSVADGNAADLVRGRLASASSDSSRSACERQGDSLEATPLPEEEEVVVPKSKRSCCHCTIL